MQLLHKTKFTNQKLFSSDVESMFVLYVWFVNICLYYDYGDIYTKLMR